MEHRTLRLKHPEIAARVLVSIIGGEALPLPPLSHCWVVITDDGTGLELYPDVLNRHGADYAEPFSEARPVAGMVLGSALPASRIVTLAQKAGWPVRRGGESVEIAVEGRYRLTIRPDETVTPGAAAEDEAGAPAHKR